VDDRKDPENLSETPNLALKRTNTTMASRSDITVDPIERWNLVQERTSEAITEPLLLLFFIILLVIRPLRSFIEHFDHFNHETVLPCLTQEEALTPAPLAAPISTAPTISPTISRIPTISTVLKTFVALSIPTPTPEKKSSIRPIISLNPLKAVPHSLKQTVDLGTISLERSKLNSL